MVRGDARETVGRAGRASTHLLPDPAGLARESDSSGADLVTNRDAAVAFGGEARISGNVAGDEECARIGARQPSLHRLRPLGEAESDGGLVVDPGDRRAGDQ